MLRKQTATEKKRMADALLKNTVIGAGLVLLGYMIGKNNNDKDDDDDRG